MRILWVAVCAIAVGLVASCGAASTPESSGPASSLSTSATSQPAKASPAKSSGGLTGFGATREAWDAAHEQAPGFTDGAAYLPLIGGKQPRYSAVSGEAGERIYSYTLSFEPGTSLKEAKAEVLREFPSGAKFATTDDDEARCLLMDIKSKQVEATLDDARPMVGFFSLPDGDSAFSSSDVREAIFTLAFPDETKDLGMC